MKISHIVAIAFLTAVPAVAQDGYLGIQLGGVEDAGAAIEAVTERSAAEIMGLQAGDVILTIDGRKVDSAQAVVSLISSRRAGDLVELTVRRGGEVVELRGMLGRRPTALRRGAPPRWQPMPEGLELPEGVELPEGFLVPEGMELPEGMDMPRFRFFELDELPGRPEAFQDLFDMRDRLQDMHDGFGFRFDTFGDWDRMFDITIPDMQFGEGTKVYLRYPEDTPEEERERLIREAKEKYGEDADVEIEFQGTGHEMRLHSGFRSGGELGGMEDFFAPDDDEPLGFLDELHEEGTEESEWFTDLEAAKAVARASGKPLLVDFYADWCAPCRQLGEEVLDNPDYSGLIHQFVPVRINTDEQRDLAAEFEVQGIPDVRILSPTGEEIERMLGFPGVQRTVAFLKKARARAGEPGGGGDAAREKPKPGSEEERMRDEVRARMAEVQKEMERLREELNRLREDG